MLANLCRKVGLPVALYAHRIELIEQGKQHFSRAGVRNLTVSSIQKQARRPVPDVGLIIVDECHHVTTSGQYARLFDSGIPVVGATATPFRLDGRGLGNMFGSLVVAARPRELVDNGFLYEPIIYSHSVPDLSGTKKTAGDFNLRDLGVRTNKPKLVADIVETWFKRANGLRTLAFAVNIAHSQAIVAAFKAAGVSSEHLDCKTAADERSAILWRLRNGQTQVVSNVGIATEGFDLPDLDCAIMARPTESLCLWLQMAGRIMRPQGSAIILDHAGNAVRHGSPIRNIDYTLEADERQAGQPLGLKLCPSCFLLVPVGVNVCPDCGADLSPVIRARMKIEQGELVPYVDQEKVWRQLVEEDHERAPVAFRRMFGYIPAIIDGEFVTPTKDNKHRVLKHFIHLQYSNREQARWAKNRYKNFFGVWPVGFDEVRREVMKERYEIRKANTE